MTTLDCVFCDVAAGTGPATVVRQWDDALAIVPLGPVTPGHVLVIPRQHVSDATVSPVVTAATMLRAAELARDIGGDLNIITSKGASATQTVYHLHIHLVPRRADDRLPLPWTPQHLATGCWTTTTDAAHLADPTPHEGLPH
ncbi:HIT family protein [Streptomyces sp. NPDC053048]|uniref:HIT family protein n=1 Tax=Streptomyces sp. NPDC053048 TaxID=3365694 RepID=UPI0037D2F31C